MFPWAQVKYGKSLLLVEMGELGKELVDALLFLPDFFDVLRFGWEIFAHMIFVQEVALGVVGEKFADQFPVLVQGPFADFAVLIVGFVFAVPLVFLEEAFFFQLSLKESSMREAFLLAPRCMSASCLETLGKESHRQLL